MKKTALFSKALIAALIAATVMCAAAFALTENTYADAKGKGYQYKVTVYAGIQGEFEGGKPAHNGNPQWDTREARSQHKFARELQDRGAMAFVCYQPGGSHSEASWGEQVPHIMEYLWKDNPYEF